MGPEDCLVATGGAIAIHERSDLSTYLVKDLNFYECPNRKRVYGVAPL